MKAGKRGARDLFLCACVIFAPKRKPIHTTAPTQTMKHHTTTPCPILCICLFLCFFSSGLSAQSVLKGRVIDGSDGSPLEFATVSLFGLPDSGLVGGGMTGPDGRFSVEVSAQGAYFAEIQFIGYVKEMIPEFEVTSKKGALDLGDLMLKSDALALEEVEVRAERSQMTMKLDKRVFNVGKDLTNAGANAAEILNNVPSITVDVEGNISLRGSQNVRILVNGKPSGLIGMGDVEALRRMQGDIIDRIELITNPSARYEAEGEAGIINIILKKDQEKGFNGSIAANTGYPHNHGASYNLNYRQADLNWFSNFGINYRRAPGGGYTNQQFFDDLGQPGAARRIDRDTDRGGLGGNFQFGADWLMNDRNTLTSSLLLRVGQDDNISELLYTDYDPLGMPLGSRIRTDNELEDEFSIESALTYRKTYEEEGREWVVDVRYNDDRDTERSDFFEQGYLQEDPLTQQSEITEYESNFLFQTDYVHPIGERGKLEGGLRAALRTINNAFRLEELNDNGQFVPNPAFNDELEYTENVYAAYLIAANEWDKWGLQVGLRTELSDISALLLESEVQNDQNYLNLFPSVALTRKLNDKNQLQASYSRRISRPYFRLLLPVSNFGDPLNLWIGNPALRPEFTDSWELNYLLYHEKGSIMFGTFYRHTTNVIERVTLPQGDGTTLRSPINLSTRNSYGLEMNLSGNITKWWSLNGDLNFFRSEIDGEFEGVDFSAETFIWTGRLNNTLQLGNKIDMQLSVDYRSPRITTQGKSLALYSINAGFSMEVLKGKGTMTLSGRDLFNTRIWRYSIDLPELQSDSETQWRRSQGVTLSFTYRLNQDKQRRGRGDGRGRQPWQEQRSGGGDF